jgi:hypothetical protein
MRSIIEVETEAKRLRRHLESSTLHSVAKLFFGIRFLGSFQGNPAIPAEVYLREFLPTLADIAARMEPQQFLPRERKAFHELIAMIEKSPAAGLFGTELNTLRTVATNLNPEQVERWFTEPMTSPQRELAVRLNCLFVEDYPDLDSQSRGRLLQLELSGFSLPKAKEDDIVVTNTLEDPENRFLEQAKDSVVAARKLLEEKYGLEPSQHFQFKFAIDSTGARFSGDSLGVAFAVGAIALVSRLTDMREMIDIPPRVSFSSALTRDGELKPISLKGLGLKIERAFFSPLTDLVVPQEQLPDARSCLEQLQASYPTRKLNLIGAGTLDDVVSDRRLTHQTQLSLPVFLSRKLIRRFRSRWVEIPLLVALSGILLLLVLYWADRTPFELKYDLERTDILNRYGHRLWSLPQWGDLPYNNRTALLNDINGDGNSEILFMPSCANASPHAGWLYIYSASGDSLMALDGRLCQVYPTDKMPCTESFSDVYPNIAVAHVQGRLKIITVVNRNSPARAYVKIWDPDGSLSGWYINSGTGSFEYAVDLTADGKEDLVFVAFANRLSACAVFVLPADSATGISPPYIKVSDSFDLTNVPRGNQLHYAVIYPSEVAQILSPQSYQGGLEAGLIENKGIKIWSKEGQVQEGLAVVGIYYTFDSTFRIESLQSDDHYDKKLQEFQRRGEIAAMPRDAYFDSLFNRVTYWRDSGWVTEGELRVRATPARP